MPRDLRILDFDVECLPGHWIGGDYVSKIITAVSWKWIGERGRPEYLTHYRNPPSILSEALATQIAEADLVTGHYIRGFDLPLLNGMLLWSNCPPMAPVLASDTKLDLKKAMGRSKSQENLAASLGIKAPKVKRSLREWEAFNLREPGGEPAGIERVVGDVIQHIEMRAKLIELGWLGPPKRWSPESKGAAYSP